MKQGTLLMAAAAAALLVACATPQERAARMQAEMDQMIVVYGPACSKLGYNVNTDQWRHCVLQLSAKDDVERARAHYSLSYGHPRWAWGGYWGPYWW